ncbi:MAG: addiction module component [Alkalinema sp. CACIAM 70d]|nr:MAG: addiction module component [Alkalinema sp. CACIAM 70d]
MLTLDQLISEAAALSDADKAILIDQIMASMVTQIDQDTWRESIKQAQERIVTLDRGEVQTIPGEIALAQIRQQFAQ